MRLIIEFEPEFYIRDSNLMAMRIKVIVNKELITFQNVQPLDLLDDSFIDIWMEQSKFTIKKAIKEYKAKQRELK